MSYYSINCSHYYKAKMKTYFKREGYFPLFPTVVIYIRLKMYLYLMTNTHPWEKRGQYFFL